MLQVSDAFILRESRRAALKTRKNLCTYLLQQHVSNEATFMFKRNMY